MTAGGTEAILSMAIPAMKMGLTAAQQSNEQAARDASTRSKIEQIQQAQKLDERRRREQLRHALAARRARFGAQGISSSGSADAVLAGLAMEAERQDSECRSRIVGRFDRRFACECAAILSRLEFVRRGVGRTGLARDHGGA